MTTLTAIECALKTPLISVMSTRPSYQSVQASHISNVYMSLLSIMCTRLSRQYCVSIVSTVPDTHANSLYQTIA